MRFLIILAFTVLVVGLLGPYLAKIGLGRLPGDIVIRRARGNIYFPFGTCILLSIVLSGLLLLVSR
jgi:hypothetical protein